MTNISICLIFFFCSDIFVVYCRFVVCGKVLKLYSRFICTHMHSQKTTLNTFNIGKRIPFSKLSTFFCDCIFNTVTDTGIKSPACIEMNVYPFTTYRKSAADDLENADAHTCIHRKQLLIQEKGYRFQSYQRFCDCIFNKVIDTGILSPIYHLP